MFTPPAYAEDVLASPTTVSGIATPVRAEERPARPGVLTALYASYGVLQAYDVYSTRQALAHGGREANPMLQDVAGHTGALMAVKAGVGLSTIAAAERLWKTNKAAAIGVMIAGNGVAAMVAAHNTRSLSQRR